MIEENSKPDVKRIIAVAIAGAFGFIIALIWRDVIVGVMNMSGLNVDEFQNAAGAITATIVAIVITIICVAGIYYISKWGGVESK